VFKKTLRSSDLHVMELSNRRCQTSLVKQTNKVLGFLAFGKEEKTTTYLTTHFLNARYLHMVSNKMLIF
jgi:hypothetical protein